MSFLHPEVLYYMLVPLVVLFAFLLSQKESQAHFFSQEVMEKLKVTTNGVSLKTRNILYLCIFILMIIGIAGPVIKKGKVEIKSKSADIIIALDISDSMLAEDVYPNRLKLAKSKAIELLKIAPNERIGIVAFAKNSYLVSPMSFDHDAVGFLLKQLNTDSITEKGTNFLSLLNVVQNTIKTQSQKHLLILSDGGDSNDFSEEIAYAKENNIVVYILGLGTNKGSPIKKEDGSFITYEGEVIVSKLNEDISKFATATGGVYIKNVKSNEDISTMLREIEASSEKKELKTEIIEKFIPLFYYPVALALLLLLFATSSLKRKTPVALVFVALFLPYGESRAGLLDFMDLNEANTAYSDAQYSKAEKIYTKYASDTNNTQSYYNLGNALYKQEKYDEAIKAYKKASFDNNISKANNQANIGNTYIKEGKEKALENAVKSYEKSLSFHEDKKVRENLEAVKKEIEKQKKDKEKKEDKKDKDKDKKQDKSKDNKEDSDDKKDGEDSDKSDEKSNKNSKDKKKQDKDAKEDKKEEEQKKSEEKKSEEEKKDKKEDLKELNKDKSNADASSGNPSQSQEEKMSDAEEKKWLDKLNAQQNTYMYRLNNQTKEENSDEKPW
ncbi:MAG: VWA domain-containing protein [Sulfurimonas sp.]|nr:VWA domain-containing protein [Sulfurimonas sp.]MDQ7062462.1 VWA domain-containing protein [Sulfurimonas sp.]